MADDQKNNDDQGAEATNKNAAQGSSNPAQSAPPSKAEVSSLLQKLKTGAPLTPAEIAQAKILQASREGNQSNPDQQVQTAAALDDKDAQIAAGDVRGATAQLGQIKPRTIPQGAIVSPGGAVLSVPGAKQSAKSQLKQQRKQAASAYLAQVNAPAPTPTVNQQPPIQAPLRSRLKTVFAGQKKTPQPVQPPSGGKAKHGGSFIAFDQYTKGIQKPTASQKTPAGNRGGGGAVGLAVGALAGLAGSAGKRISQPSPQAASQTADRADETEYRAGENFTEQYIKTAEIPEARNRALHFFIWAGEYPQLFQFNPLDDKSPQFQLFLTNHPEIPRDILELKQTWQQYWTQFPEGMKSEQEQRQHEQLATAPAETPQTHSSESLLSLAALPIVGLQYAKESADPERMHQKKALTVLKKWQKDNPGVIVKDQLYVHNPDGSLAVNHKLFDQIPELLTNERTRSFAYKDPEHDPLLQHVRSTANNETEQEIKKQGLTIANDKEKISQIKNGVLEKHYDQFVKDSPHLAQAYKNHPHIDEALKRSTPSQATSPNLSPMSTRSRFFDRLRGPVNQSRIRYARGTKSSSKPKALPRRQPSKGGLLSRSLLPSLPGTLSLFNPARKVTLLVGLIIGSIVVFSLLFTDIAPVAVDQSDEGAKGAVTCSTGEGADQTDSGKKECEAGTEAEPETALHKTVQPFTLLSGIAFPRFHAYAQETSGEQETGSTDSIGSDQGGTSASVDTGFNPSTDVVHRIHVSYGKPFKDILVSYPIQPEVCLIAATPAPNESFTPCQNPSTITWSIKKALNPGKSASELAAITLPSVNTTFKLTLRPRPGIKDVYIISQATIVLDRAASDPSTPDTSGSVDTGNPDTPPNTNTCGGKITISNPDGTNFGDPDCSFTVDKLAALLKKEDPENADYWFTTVIPCESPGYDPNLYYRTGAAGDTPDAAGAWGLFQMGRGLNGQYDHGDVSWQKQVTNAVTYRRNVSWRYWACAKSRW